MHASLSTSDLSAVLALTVGVTSELSMSWREPQPKRVAVITRTAVERHSRAIFLGNNPKAIVLYLVQPLAAERQFVGFGWETRRDEPGRARCVGQWVQSNSNIVLGTKPQEKFFATELS
jgi:hypothetical protein